MLILVGAAVFDGDRTRRDLAVVVEGDRIAQITASPPSGGTRVELDGLTLLPGLVDCHVHLCLGGEPEPAQSFANDSLATTTLRAAMHARQTIESGVTTVRDLGGRERVVQALRDAIARGWCVGPRVLAAGQGICITGGHGWRTIAREADGADGIRHAVREQLKWGADWIKLFVTGGVMTPNTHPATLQLSLDEIQTAVTEAHNAGKRVAAHAQGAAGIAAALEAGVATIEHGIFLTDELAQRMITKHTVLVPTLIAPVRIATAGAAAGVRADAIAKAQEVCARHRDGFATALRHGVAIAAGTDAGTACNPHGNLAAELAHMVDAGMPAIAALRAATTHAAQMLGLEHEIGRIAEGYAADLIAVAGDPTVDIAALRDPRLVIARGRVVTDRRS